MDSNILQADILNFDLCNLLFGLASPDLCNGLLKMKNINIFIYT